MSPLDAANRRIFLLTVTVEGTLLLLAYLWGQWRGVPLFEIPADAELGAAVAVSVALLCFNFFWFDTRRRDSLLGEEFCRFRREVIAPFVRTVNPRLFLPIAILAGTGEEAFFRGVLLSECGWFLSGILFGVLHFGLAVRRYPLVTLLYTLVGFLFAIVAELVSLTAAAIAHGLYDLLVLIVIRRQEFPRE